MTRAIRIIGSGLAGIHLAWALHMRGVHFELIGQDRAYPAWQASAGIINPVTGKRVVKSWNIDALLPFAQKRYAEVGQKIGVPSHYHNIPLKRFFRPNSDEIERLNDRLSDPDYTAYLSSKNCDELGFKINQAAWVDVSTFVEESRAYFLAKGLFFDDFMEYSSIERWQAKSERLAIFCEGAQGTENPWFHWLDYRISRGDVVDFKTKAKLPSLLINKEKWMLPLGPNVGRMGSTYTWDNLLAPPDSRRPDELFQSLNSSIPALNEAEVTTHRVGIRPGTNDSRPYVGEHPRQPGIFILNGFGSKGASQSPWCAEALVNHMLDWAAIPQDIDVQRRVKFARGRL
ncbi:MAG: FAD-binding oxidoreductase [Opitutales bacterium]|nr:FAD-binding oxidoreductase [Opitutales bacterium]